jgi:hypothetical protein
MARKKCEHGKRKERCRSCGTAKLCEHDKLKENCKQCGINYCTHGKRKSRCKLCGGISLCEHNILKQNCKLCGGSTWCVHEKLKTRCKDCSYSSYCKHDIRQEYCKICGGSGLCRGCQLYKVTKNTNYFCSYCNPNPTVHQHTKELEIKQLLIKTIPDQKFIHDQRIIDSTKFADYRKYRPDFIFDRGTHYIVLEVDEKQHGRIKPECEQNREYKIAMIIGLPCIFIRYNPDTYRHKGVICNLESKFRHELLIQTLKEYLNKECPITFIHTHYLFYNTCEELYHKHRHLSY